jgi:retinol dehydrogenase-12
MAARMEGRVCLVTGGTGGIGYETAVGLARMGAMVVVHGRSVERAEVAAEGVRRRSGRTTVEAIAADLASLAEVRRMAQEMSSRFPGLAVLVNNSAAASVGRQDRKSVV